MKPDDTGMHAHIHDSIRGPVHRLISALPRVFVPAFALLFFAFSICFAVAAVVEFALPILENGDFLGGLIKGLHTGVVALAVYELAQIVHQESGPATGAEPAPLAADGDQLLGMAGLATHPQEPVLKASAL